MSPQALAIAVAALEAEADEAARWQAHLEGELERSHDLERVAARLVHEAGARTWHTREALDALRALQEQQPDQEQEPEPPEGSEPLTAIGAAVGDEL